MGFITQSVGIIRRLSLVYFVIYYVNMVNQADFALLSRLAVLGVLLLSFFGLASGAPRLSRYFWLAQSVLIGVFIALNWERVDNHVYLMGYWSLALFLASMVDEASENTVLFWNGEKLIGLCMLFAVLQKTYSDSYFNGLFFYHEFFSGKRFLDGIYGYNYMFNLFREGLSGWVRNHEIWLRALVDFLNHTLALPGVEFRTKLMIAGITWWTWFVEALLAIFFLFGRYWVSRARHVLLIVFSVCIYSVANIHGFSLLLALMGYSSTESRSIQRAYLVLMVYLVILKYFELYQLVSISKVLLA